MKTFSFRVIGNPIAQPRQRIRVVKTRAGRVFAQNYTPTKSPANEWKRMVSIEALNAALQRRHEFKRPISGPLAVSMGFYFERPRHHIGADGKPRKSSPQNHTQKPDLDNLAKAVLDALVSASIIADDAHVVWLEVSKQWADNHPHGVECSITWDEK